VLEHGNADLVLMAAAVADYRPEEQRADKRPKNGAPWKLTLEPTEDILARLAASRAAGQVLVGFAADQGDEGLARARDKRARKGVDVVVFNDVSREDIGFDAADNEVVIIEPGGERVLPKASKDRIAAAIVGRAEELLRERS
jgi:phosphopantothenoylcysteine synthetase/decarboxylase